MDVDVAADPDFPPIRLPEPCCLWAEALESLDEAKALSVWQNSFRHFFRHLQKIQTGSSHLWVGWMRCKEYSTTQRTAHILDFKIISTWNPWVTSCQISWFTATVIAHFEEAIDFPNFLRLMGVMAKKARECARCCKSVRVDVCRFVYFPNEQPWNWGPLSGLFDSCCAE